MENDEKIEVKKKFENSVIIILTSSYSSTNGVGHLKNFGRHIEPSLVHLKPLKLAQVITILRLTTVLT